MWKFRKPYLAALPLGRVSFATLASFLHSSRFCRNAAAIFGINWFTRDWSTAQTHPCSVSNAAVTRRSWSRKSQQEFPLRADEFRGIPVVAQVVNESVPGMDQSSRTCDVSWFPDVVDLAANRQCLVRCSRTIIVRTQWNEFDEWCVGTRTVSAVPQNLARFWPA